MANQTPSPTRFPAPQSSDASAAASPVAITDDSSPSSTSSRAAMDSANLKLLTMLLPKLPLIVRVAVMHVLNLSEEAKYLDLRSALVVAVLRSFLEPNPDKPRTISSVQKLTLKDPGVKGRMWVSTYAAPVPPEMGVRDRLMDAVENMRDTSIAEPKFKIPDLEPVEAEWTGYRANAGPQDPLPYMSAKDMYGEMMKECTHPTTVLYLHGGAYYLCDPSTHRATTKKLAKLTGGRSYSVRYRLAPQHPFPAALLDSLVSYLTLLYPPPDAYHEAVKPEHIVMAGDSAGGNLVLALLQLLLEFRRNGTTIEWYGETREVPLPAGVAGNSPWLDITQSSPSWEGTAPAQFDYLPKPEVVAKGKVQECDIWPSTPPRKWLYVDDLLVTHPLASVVLNKSWKGAPPMYICTGWEILALEDKYLAKKLDGEGIPLVFEEYEAMPHCFAMILDKTPNSARCFEGWSGFIKQVVDNPTAIHSTATEIKARSLEEIPLTFEDLSSVTEDEIKDRVYTKAGFKKQEASAKL